MYRIIHQATFKILTTTISFIFDSHRQSSNEFIIPYHYSITKHDDYFINTMGENLASQGPLKDYISHSQFFILPYLNNLFQNTNIIPLTITDTYYIETDEEYQYLINMSKLNSFLLYKDGWFGDGSLKINRMLVHDVQISLIQLDKQPEVFPLATGGVQMKWERDAPYLEVLLHPDKKDETEIYCEVFDLNTGKIKLKGRLSQLSQSRFSKVKRFFDDVFR